LSLSQSTAIWDAALVKTDSHSLKNHALLSSQGTAIWDAALVKTGVLAELAGVALTCLIGFCAGLVVSGWKAVPERYNWWVED
jgi:hypothetical protein